MAANEFTDLWDDWRKQKTEAARERLLSAYLPLVMRVFAKLRIGLARDVEERLSEDLKHAGVMGLLEAFQHYVPGGGAAFSTYAAYRIRGAMLDELRRQDWLSKASRRRLKEMQRAFAEVAQRLGRPAMDEEIAKHLKIPVERYREELVEIGPATLVFAEGLSTPEGGESLMARMADPSASDPSEDAGRKEVLEKLEKLIERLPGAERKVLELLVYEDLGQSEIAAVLGVSRSRVSQIYASAVLRLQAGLLPILEKA